jgi:glycosyltransferase involved in cell wall biosynthesis
MSAAVERATPSADLPSSAHVIGSKTLGGAERFYLRLLDALHARGAKVDALLRRGSEVVAHVPPGVPVVETPMRTVWDPWSRHCLTKAIGTRKPDIVQTYMGRATRLTHLPRAGRPVHVARLGGYYKLDGYRHAHAWIGNTRGVCDYLVQQGMPADRVFHIANFIDLPPPVEPGGSAMLRSANGIPADATVLVTAGRFVPVKGLEFLLSAFAQLPAVIHGRPLWLVLVGDGPLREALRTLAARLGVDGRTTWTGWQTQPGPYYAMADLVVFPSLPAEALGNVILEAWAYGKPLVTTSFHGAREITRHGEDAWRVPCEDAAALAEGIRVVAADDGLATALAQAGAKRVREAFSRPAVVNQYLELYRTLLGQ